MADFRNTKEGRNVAQKYADILHLSRPKPPVKYPRMALSNRAKIFSPFAAKRCELLFLRYLPLLL